MAMNLQLSSADSMHARYHNPNVARFLSVDPGRDNNPKVPQSWNLYAYVRNGPALRTDPTGLITYVVVYGTSNDETTQSYYKQMAEARKNLIVGGSKYNSKTDQVVLQQVKSPAQLVGLQRTKFTTGPVNLTVIAHSAAAWRDGTPAHMALNVRESDQGSGADARHVVRGLPSGGLGAAQFKLMDPSNFAAGLPITLLGCQTAATGPLGEISLAQAVANITGLPVGGYVSNANFPAASPTDDEFQYFGPGH
jgi:RHS repeat-associated protein